MLHNHFLPTMFDFLNSPDYYPAIGLILFIAGIIAGRATKSIPKCDPVQAMGVHLDNVLSAHQFRLQTLSPTNVTVKTEILRQMATETSKVRDIFLTFNTTVSFEDAYKSILMKYPYISLET